MGFLGKLTDETVNFIKTNTPCVCSPEDPVKVYALGSGSLYNKVNDYTPMYGSPIDNV